MKVHELITQLQTADGDVEGNSFSPLDVINKTAYSELNKDIGFTEEDMLPDDAVNAVVFWSVD